MSLLSSTTQSRGMSPTLSLLVGRQSIQRDPLALRRRYRSLWVRVVRSLLGWKPPARRSRRRRYRSLHWLDMAAFDKEWHLSLWIRFARSLLVDWKNAALYSGRELVV